MSRFALVVSAAILAAAGTAAAQSAPKAQCPYGTADKCPQPEPATPPPAEPQSEIEPQPQPTYSEPTYTEQSTLDRYGVLVTLGGGVTDFVQDTMRDTTDIGGAWNVTVGYGIQRYLGLEASYIGSAQSIDALGLDTSAVLVGNGVQGAVRVNVLTTAFQPFIYGGAAWRHYNLTNENFNTSDVADSDDVLELPAGVGISWTYRGLLLDARGEYRWAFEEDMVPSLTRADTAGMDRWGVSANIGFSF